MKIFCAFSPKNARPIRIFAVFLLALAVFAAGGAIESALSQGSRAVSGEMTVSKKQSGKTSEERLGFISSLGWETDGSESCESVVIPKKFDEIYKSYNELQLSQGLDLTRYRGRECMKYTYVVTNFPGKDESEAHLNLLVYKDRIIGGDVSSLGLGGACFSLIYPSPENIASL